MDTQENRAMSPCKMAVAETLIRNQEFTKKTLERNEIIRGKWESSTEDK